MDLEVVLDINTEMCSILVPQGFGTVEKLALIVVDVMALYRLLSNLKSPTSKKVYLLYSTRTFNAKVIVLLPTLCGHLYHLLGLLVSL